MVTEEFETQSQEEKRFTEPIYKEWFKTKTSAGFIALNPYLLGKENEYVGKVGVDIGKVDPSNNSVVSATQCWVDAIELCVYLNAICYHHHLNLYPKRYGVNSPSSFISFGGSGEVSRVIKIEQWGSNKDNEGKEHEYAWKCAHFKGKRTETGAIEPIYNESIRMDMIKRNRSQLLVMHYRLDAEIKAAISSAS